MDINEIGNKIKNRRIQLNLTQKELAQEMNVSNQLISKWETGESVPSLEYLQGLCSALNVSYSFFLGNENAPENSMESAKPKKARKIKWSWKWFGLSVIALWVSAFIAGFTVLTYYVFVPAANRENYFKEIERAYNNYFDQGYYCINEISTKDGDEKTNVRCEGYIDDNGAPVFYKSEADTTVKDGILTYKGGAVKYHYIPDREFATVEELALYNIFPDEDDDLGFVTADEKDMISYIRKVKGGYYLEMKDEYFTDRLSGTQKKNYKLTEKLKGKIEVKDGLISFMEVTVKYLNKPDNEHFTITASFRFISERPEIEHINLEDRSWNGTYVGNNWYPSYNPPQEETIAKTEDLVDTAEFMYRLSDGNARKISSDYAFNRALLEGYVKDGGDCFWYAGGSTVKIFYKNNLSSPKTVNLKGTTITDIHYYDNFVYYITNPSSFNREVWATDVRTELTVNLFRVYSISMGRNVDFKDKYMMYYGETPSSSRDSYNVYNLADRKFKYSNEDLSIRFMDSSGNVYCYENIDETYLIRYYNGKNGKTLKGTGFFYNDGRIVTDNDSIYIADGDVDLSTVTVYRYEKGELKETLKSNDKRFEKGWRQLTNGYCYVTDSYNSGKVFDSDGNKKQFEAFKYKDVNGEWVKESNTEYKAIIETLDDKLIVKSDFFSDYFGIYDANDLTKPLYYMLSVPYKNYDSTYPSIVVKKVGATTLIAVRTDSEENYGYDVYCF